MIKRIYSPLIFITLCLTFAACSKSRGPLSIFKKLSPHDAYAQRLKDNGFDRTAMGSAWLLNADQIISKPLNISIPYKETGYFAADKITSTALRFDAKRGQKIHITISKKPTANFNIYADLFEESGTQVPKISASADTVGAVLDHEIKQTGKYILRLQPELLRSGEYTLTITAGPSLNFPVSASGKPHIGSFWGDGRDENGRQHEGIDIFAPRHTAAIAAANGTITGVTVNNLGGNIVFMRPDNEDYTLYYAHLDVQTVQPGQMVVTGDTLGLVGNTGNARTTSPHLHFGIYTNNGAIDPLAFIYHDTKQPLPISAPLKYLNTTARTNARNSKLYNLPSDKALAVSTLDINTAFNVNAATAGWFKVTLPNGQSGYINSKSITETRPIRNIILKTEKPLYNAPDSANAPRKKIIQPGQKVEVLALYQTYLMVNTDGETGWIKQ
jgi:murein DD-endopeptidase MepM/ murein hydrolase activator NlpD